MQAVSFRFQTSVGHQLQWQYSRGRHLARAARLEARELEREAGPRGDRDADDDDHEAERGDHLHPRRRQVVVLLEGHRGGAGWGEAPG